MAWDVGRVSEYATSVVRLFSGWADSAVWFSEPVAYEDTRLDDDLVADLRAWDDSFYAGLTSGYEWRSPDLETRYHRAGARLARRLADQVGDDFQVEHDVGGTRRRVRAAGPARNPDAADAFHAMAARAGADRSTRRAMVERAGRDGHVLSWSAERPAPGRA